MKSKGQTAIQFNWIFILIVGAIILAFFFSIVLSQQKSSQQAISIDFLTKFEKALNGIAAAQGKMQIFDVPALGLNYECTSTCDCEAFTGTSRASAPAAIPMTPLVIFSPSSIKGTSILVWSRDWAYPFRVTNLIYMTSPEVKYLIEDTSLGEQIYNMLPAKSLIKDNKVYKAVDKQLFTDKIPSVSGSYKVRIILTTDKNPTTYDLSSIKDASDKDISAVKITQESNGQEKATFYRKDSIKKYLVEDGESFLFGDETLMGAVLSEDLNSFTCQMNDAFKILNFVSLVYAEKQIALAGATGENSVCTGFYGDLSVAELADSAKNFNFKNQNSGIASGISQESLSLMNVNEDIQKEGCPQIY